MLQEMTETPRKMITRLKNEGSHWGSRKTVKKAIITAESNIPMSLERITYFGLLHWAFFRLGSRNGSMLETFGCLKVPLSRSSPTTVLIPKIAMIPNMPMPR